ncbi:aquaporin [Truncatella angustata]|uniref:Aquaporin n=1 Tax=Truncatella angustata TaxID=152316 RepID=A0A9P8ZXY1_9PEZI|nr:aquaporin [Truncatella angustata]KAH6654454.1 aquaporin [Truncatella angustata]
MNVDRPGRRIRLPWESRSKVAARDRDDDATLVSRRVPLAKHLPPGVKNHFVAMMSEFVGTFMFLLFAFGGTNAVNTAPTASGDALNADPAKLLYISLCFGMSLAVNAWVFFRISGGLFNPAVTLGMMLVGAVTYIRGMLIVISQILGAIAASAVVLALFPGPLNVRTSLAGGTTVVQGLFIEMFLTAMLVFAIFMLAAEKHRATFIAPVGIGLALFICELMGVYYTGGSVNPARTFGPCVVLGSFYSYHWIYWVGPILGSLLATGFYLLVKALEYETVNPDQDTDGEMRLAFDPNTGEERKVVHANNGTLRPVTASTDGLRLEVRSQGHDYATRPSTSDNTYMDSNNLEAGTHVRHG